MFVHLYCSNTFLFDVDRPLMFMVIAGHVLIVTKKLPGKPTRTDQLWTYVTVK